MEKTNAAAEKPTNHPLRTWRHQHNMSLGKLAQQLGVTAAHLSQIEHYKGRASWDFAQNLERITGINRNEFYIPKDKIRNGSDVAAEN